MVPGCLPNHCWWLCFAFFLRGGGLGLGLNGGLFMGLSPVGWCLAVCLWLGPPWFGCWFSFALAYGGISHENSSLFNIEINLILCFRLGALTELGAFVRTDVFVYFCVRGGIGAQGGVAWCFLFLCFSVLLALRLPRLGKRELMLVLFVY